MNAVSEFTRSFDDIEVMDVSRLEWRVRDARISADDARSVIGFIEKKGDAYEVMMFGDPLQFSVHEDMRAAMREFVTEYSVASIRPGIRAARHDGLTEIA